MNSEQLICFAAVVQEGTISGGARRLNLSQPPVSLQIKNLEKECGVKLLERGARQIRLTEAGKVLYDYAQKILELQQAAQSDMRSFQAGNKGSLRLGIISSGTGEKFLKGLTHFTLEHPDVPFQVYEANTYGLLEALDKEKIELALIRTPFPAAGLERTVLTQEAFAAAGAATMLYGLPDTLTLKELAGRPLLVYRRWEAILRDLGDRWGASLSFRCLCDDARTCLQWAASGLGIALVPESLLDLAPELPRRTVNEPQRVSQVCLVRKKGRKLGEAEKAFWGEFKGKSGE